MSRATLAICGVLLMTAVAVPMTQIMENESESDMADRTADAALTIDRFWRSDLDEMYLRGSDILPSDRYTVRIDGRILTVNDTDGNSYSAGLAHSCGQVEMGYGDTAVLTRDGDSIIFRRRSRRSY